jgi:lipopolysaccharide export system protein LptA
MLLTKRERLLLHTTWGICLTFSSPLSANAAPTPIPPPPGNQPQVTEIGDVTIRSTHIKANFQHASVVFTGPDVVIESRDKKNPTQFRILADEVTGKQTPGSNKETGIVDMTGHIRYTIKQKTPDGMRTIQGTAGHAAYQQATKRILLTAGVLATLTDEAKLEAPATLKSTTVTILNDNSQRYELAGDPAVNDVQFTPRRNAPGQGKEPGPPIAGTPIHLHNFLNGEIVEGHHITLNGPESTVEYNDPVEHSVGSLVGNRITADFDTGLSRAAANGSVRFYYERPGTDRTKMDRAKMQPSKTERAGKQERSAKPEDRQSVRGHSDAATYSAAQHRLVVTGNVEADIVDPASLLEPAHVIAGQIVEHTEEPGKIAGQPGPGKNLPDNKGQNKGQQEPRMIYEISGTPERTSLVFRPRPQEQKQTAPPASAPATPAAPTVGMPSKTDALQGFALGTVYISGFDSGTYEPGRSALLIGDRTLCHTEDKQARTSSTLRATRMTAKFAEDQTLQQWVAVGNVRFNMQQPDVPKQTEPAGKPGSGKPAAAPFLSTFSATTTQATVTHTADGQMLTMPGPWRTSRTTDDPNKLALSSGEKGDTLTYNLTTGDADIDSGNKPPTTVVWTENLTKQTAAVKKSAGATTSPTGKKRNP